MTFHARWYDSSGTPYIISPTPGDVFESTGNERVVDGVLWKRYYARFTTPTSLSTTNMQWHVGYTDQAGLIPTGKRWMTNFMMSDVPLISNYAGDYDADGRGVRGYEAISIQNSSNLWGGLELSANTNSLADGTVDSSSWHFAIGARQPWPTDSELFPGPGQSVSVAELWIYAPVGSKIDDYQFATRHLREFSNNNFRLVATGVSTGAELASCYLNDVNVFTQETKVAYQMRILKFNDDMTLKSNSKYRMDNATERSNFVNALNAITTEPFVILSNGIMYGDASIDTAINQFGPVEYRGSSYFSQYPYSYAAFGTGELGIVYDRCVHEAEGNSVVDSAFEDKAGIGSAGFGQAIVEATAQSPSSYFPEDSSWVLLTDHNLSEGQHLLFKARGSISRTDAIAGTSRWCTLYIQDGSGVALSNHAFRFQNSELIETQEAVVELPVGAYRFRIWSDIEDERFDYVQLFKGGMSSPDGVPHLISNINGMAAQDVINSPISGNAVNGDSWYKAYISDSNLYAGISMPVAEADNVHWGDYVLSNGEKAYLRTPGASSPIEMQEVSIDPSRPYYISIWANGIDKSESFLYLSVKAKDGLGTDLPLTLSNGTASSPLVNMDRVYGFPENNNKWILLHGFILPHDWTDAQHQEFEDKFKHYFGVINPDEVPNQQESKGVGYYTTAADKTFRWNPNAETLTFRYKDNTTVASETMWALPIVSEVKVACFFENSLTAIDFAMQ